MDGCEDGCEDGCDEDKDQMDVELDDASGRGSTVEEPDLVSYY